MENKNVPLGHYSPSPNDAQDESSMMESLIVVRPHSITGAFIRRYRQYYRPIDSSPRFWLNDNCSFDVEAGMRPDIVPAEPSRLTITDCFGGIMSTTTNAVPIQREPELLGQTVVVIGGSAGIGLETARRACGEGAKVILTGRNPEPLRRAAMEVDALSSAAFDATDFKLLERFFDGLPAPVDHVLVTGPGPYYAPLADFDLDKARRDIEAHLFLPLQVARNAGNKVRPGGTLLFMGGTGGRSTARGLVLISALTAALPAMTKNLALELAPVRVNLIAAGFVDTPLSASLLGDELDNRRNQLRAMLPIRRVVGPADVAALAVHIMSNTALTGATYDIDGGQQLVAA
jgi:NAD(P)-dependent dehydrogenase (short-subunit alcohol dehydrogenase family)